MNNMKDCCVLMLINVYVYLYTYIYLCIYTCAMCLQKNILLLVSYSPSPSLRLHKALYAVNLYFASNH